MTQLDASTRLEAPPVEGKDALTMHLESGCKPQDAWRIGTEHEKFGFCLQSLTPLPYDGPRSIRAVLQGLAEKFDWVPLYEGRHLVALKQAGASITLEPGGQFELSGAPLTTLHETCKEVRTHLDQVKTVSGSMEIGFIGIGHTPNWRRDEMPLVPKGRYEIMRRYMPQVGNLGLDMMHRTSTVQVNLDFSSEADMVKKFRTSLALQPLATALFANSPLVEGKDTGYKSWRANIWTDTDTDRTGLLDFVFEDGFGFERYTDYMLDVPMYFLFRDGDYVDATGQSFRAFLDGRLALAPGQRPTMDDWQDHLSTAFPEVRMKTFLEMRGADSSSWSGICALPAFWVGLLYDNSALEAAWDVARPWTRDDRRQLRLDAARFGLEARIGRYQLRDIAKEIVNISRSGLKARAKLDASGNDESGFLSILNEMIDTGMTGADVIKHDYFGEMNQDMSKLFAKYAF